MTRNETRLESQRIGRVAPFHSADFSPCLSGVPSGQARQSLTYPCGLQARPVTFVGWVGSGR